MTFQVDALTTGAWVIGLARSEGQFDALEKIAARANANGCDEVSLIDGTDARELQAPLRCVAAVDSPRIGIAASHATMTALHGEFENAGGTLAGCWPAKPDEVGAGFIARLVDGPQSTSLKATYVINVAGLAARTGGRSISGVPREPVPSLSNARGSYCTLSGRTIFQRLIYPVSEIGGLRVHLTLGQQGQASFSADVEWIDSPEYSADSVKVDGFYEARTSSWAACDFWRLQPGYAGTQKKRGGARSAWRRYCYTRFRYARGLEAGKSCLQLNPPV